MKTQFTIPNLAFVMMVAITGTGTKIHAASTIKTAGVSHPGTNTFIYERALNPYINITANHTTVGSTYSVRDQDGRIIRTGIVKSTRILSIATDKLTTGIYSVHVGRNILEHFIVK